MAAPAQPAVPEAPAPAGLRALVRTWAAAGIVYAAAYVALVLALGSNHHARLIVGSIGLMLPPLALLTALFRRRRDWAGRHAVFWAAIAAWPLLWMAGQIGWTFDEVFRAIPLPWFRWHIIPQLCGSALPLIALVAWPHRGERPETAPTAAIDVAVLAFLTGFLYWSLIVAPGMDPANAPGALAALAVVGPVVRLASALGLLWAMWRADGTPWARTYERLAIGLLAAFVVLIGLSRLTLTGDYQTGSPADIGWMLPFWFAAWAASTAPSSERQPSQLSPSTVNRSSPALLLAAIVAVPVVGYGSHLIVPASRAIDRMREIATAMTLVCGLTFVVIRLVVERRAARSADQHVRLLAMACEQAGDLIVITRRDRIEYANDAFCRATGYLRDELATLAASSLVAEQSKPAIEPLREQIREQRIVRAHTAIVRRDGSTFEALWSAAPMLDEHSRVSYIIAVIRDITEELELRDQLVRSERLSAIGELVSGVAHELNNPLQSVIGTLELMLAEPLEPQLRDDVDRARAEAARAGRIIRNLLAFVRRSPSERLLTDINELVQATVAIRAYDLSQSNIEVREDYSPNLPVVLANRDEIQQILLNLVINAQHAIADAGRRGVLEVRTYVTGDRAIVEVQDDGPGVSPELAGRIFEPFFTTKTANRAPGLGLSLAFGIANAHGGSLELVPTARGACFRLSLPGAGFPGPAHVH